ncbi:hypothetical protein [Flavobacterium johnsoniae]|uniref:hypothetical protein n=1 Tax=Flavobacterium johnsoniae TaxID=986 RepID=UPI003D96F130
MKKITFLVLMIQSVFVFAQTKTVVTMYGEKVTINPYVNNGLTANNGYIQLGGALTQPSVLTTTSAFTLALKGLQTGVAADNLVVTDANGVLKTITKETLSNGFAKGSLLSTNATIAITGGTNKLFDGDAIIDIAPGAFNTTLITNNLGKVVWSADRPWILEGNNNGAVKSIGTNDAYDLPFETNGIEKMRITTDGKLLVNTAAPLTGGSTAKVQINGVLQIADGTQGVDKVLTSDANGVATWKASAVSDQLFTFSTPYPATVTLPYPMGQGLQIGADFTVAVSGIYSIFVDFNLPPGFMLEIRNRTITFNRTIYYSQSDLRLRQHTLVYLKAGVNYLRVYNDAHPTPIDNGGPYWNFTIEGPVN